MHEPDFVQEWLQIALGDFESAEYLFGKPHKKPLEIICYLCEQSVEKSLKAYLYARGEGVPKTHDTGDLCECCAELQPAFEFYQKPCDKLALYATQTRYPVRIEIEEPDAAQALRWAKEIYHLSAEQCKLTPNP
jgi:HEPN domain-containing protein